jgi:hypothetical protein
MISSGSSESGTPTDPIPIGSRTPLVPLSERQLPFSSIEAQQSSEEIRAQLADLGWQQGSVLPREPELNDAVKLIPYSSLSALPEPPFWLIVTYNDCATIGGNLESDPAVEVIVATPLDRVRESRRHVRHSRELHFHLVGRDGRQQAVQVNVRDRGFISRKLLTKYSPDASISVPGNSIAEIAGLLSGRYDHVAFPDAFERRMAKAKYQLEKVLKDHVGVLAEIFLIVKPFREITSDNEQYTLSVYAVVHDEVVDGAQPKLNALKDTIAGAIRQSLRRCGGIELEKVVVCGFDDITVREFGGMKQIDFSAMKHAQRAETEAILKAVLPSQDS